MQSARQTRGGGGFIGLFCLKCDIARYFASIDHKILLGCIAKKIADKKCLWLLEEIIASSHEQVIIETSCWKEAYSPTDSIFVNSQLDSIGLSTGLQNDSKISRRVGIPIGNLTSQLFANIYLNELDRFVKHELREPYYIRYMDDFLFLGRDKKQLHVIKERIAEFLRGRLRLALHPKKAVIFPARLGIDFLGYHIFERHRLLRKSTVKRFIRRTKHNERALRQGAITVAYRDSALRSWIAYAEHGNSWRLRQKLGKTLGVELLTAK